MNGTAMRRETFLRVSGGMGLGMTIGLAITPSADALSPQAPVMLNPYVKISPDDGVTVFVSKSEMGQGVFTTLPMLIAEELEYPYEQLKIEMSAAAPQYYDPGIKQQATNGSRTMLNMTKPMLQMGATAREMLIAAAAKLWEADPKTLVAKNGFVTQPSTGRSARYGALAPTAATMTVPKDIKLKTPDRYTQVGQRKRRVDIPLKVNGRAKYGMDVKVPGMLYASIQKPPVFGAKVAHYDASAALKVKGVKKVIPISTGIAVVADSTWSAMQGRFALKIAYDNGAGAKLSTNEIFAEAATLARKPGTINEKNGDVDKGFATPNVKTVSALYRGPYLAHAAMEPMNATAWVHDGIVEIWAPTQAQTVAQQAASKITGLPLSAIKITTMYLGGGFGRKNVPDVVSDAVEVAKAAGVPVKVVYSREDDTKHDFYRSTNTSSIKAAVDPSGKIVAFQHHVVATKLLPIGPKESLDPPSLAGAIQMVYDIPNLRVESTNYDPGIPVGFWRAPGGNWNTFVVESFIDELAHAAGMDPVAFRLANLKDPRAINVLKLTAAKAGWDKPRAPGRYLGVGMNELHGSQTSQVAEISVEGKSLRVHRLVIGSDAGINVNPVVVEQQLEGGALYGLSAALTGKVTIEKGAAVQNNFYDYTVLRHDAAPAIETILVPSNGPPTSMGELSTSAVPACVGNAYFAATGKRLRELPLIEAIKTA